MQPAPLPPNEADRLQELRSLHILDTISEKAFDNLTRLASSICDTPIALVSLVDEGRQWFKSHHGLETRETPREIAFCSHAILQNELYEIKDSHADPRFADNPLVTAPPHVRFYAGAPLCTFEGFNVGTLCVIDHEPRELTDSQRESLQAIADQAVALMELRRALHLRSRLQADRDRRTEQVTRFAYRSSHDLRAPALQVQNLAKRARADFESCNADDLGEQLAMIEAASIKLLSFIDGTVEFNRAELVAGAVQPVDLQRLIDEVVEHVRATHDLRQIEVRIDIDGDIDLRSEYLRLRQMLIQLVSNSVKFSNHERQEGAFVRIRAHRDPLGARITVEDNGIGIPPEYHSQYFDLYQRFHPDVAPGSGVGTSIVLRHAEAIGATVTLDSDCNGTRVDVLVPNRDLEVAL